MKKLVYIFYIFLITACAQDPYKIDSKATANTPWKKMEKTVVQSICDIEKSIYLDYGERCYTVFIGVTKEGEILIQDYYLSGEKYTDAYLVVSLDAVQTGIEERVYLLGSRLPSVNGLRRTYFKNGLKRSEKHYSNGMYHGVQTNWYASGQKMREGAWQAGCQAGWWRWWAEDGQLTGERKYLCRDSAGKEMEEIDFGL